MFKNKILRKIKNYLLYMYWSRRGFNKENVYRFISELQDEKKVVCNNEIKKFSKKHEFFPSTVIALGINEDNYKEYLNDYDYWRMFPLDGRYHKWIDNKLDLKYLLGDLGKYMPEYYFQISKENGILKLIDCPENMECSFNGVFDLLKQKQQLGIKSIEGYGGSGFYKVELKKEQILVNDKEYTKDKFESFIYNLNNYIIMEYLDSYGTPAEIYPKTVNSIRYIVGIIDGKQYKIGSFIKFGDKSSGYVDNLSSGGITCPIDNKGHFEYGYIKREGVLEIINKHPDTGKELIGNLKEWNEIEALAQKIIKRLPQLTHLGFDFVITKNGVKLLEINDKSGFLTIQKYKPLLKDTEDNYYMKKLELIKK